MGLLCHLDDACTSNPCHADAICDTSPINGSYTCSCASGYKGIDCSEDIDECEQGSPCEHDGICVNTPGSFACNCTQGFTGPRCETNVNECESHPCQNDGSCLDDPGTFRCVCMPGHSTHLCTKPKTTRPKSANCQGVHLSTYIKCPANPNNAAVNKKFTDLTPPKNGPKHKTWWSNTHPGEKRSNTIQLEQTRHIHTKKDITALYAAYSSPQNDIEEADIDAVFNAHHPTILAGDLNSKHPQCNSQTLNRKGKQLIKNSDERNLTVDAPTEDTHIYTPTGSTDVLDLVILKSVTTPYYLETINDLSSDLFPVIMTVSIETSNIQETIRTTNWQNFEKNLKLRPTYISTDNDIDTAVKQFEEDIRLALNSAITKTFRRERISDYIKIKIHQKKLLYKQYKRTLHPNAKTLLNITNEIKKDLAEHHNDQWDAKIESINNDDIELWKITKILKTKKEKIPPILGTHGIINNNSDKTEEFANYFEGIFHSNLPVDTDHEKFTDVIYKQVHTKCRDAIGVQETTTEELRNIIKTIADRKAPGHGGISNIKHQTSDLRSRRHTERNYKRYN
ncbi:hypothetical protein Trydic_g13096 [Trypoxylus dichotomus]